jgi:hypothetical protein
MNTFISCILEYWREAVKPGGRFFERGEVFDPDSRPGGSRGSRDWYVNWHTVYG